MAALTVQKGKVQGTALTLSAANAGGDTFENNSVERLLLINGGASPITVTIAARETAPDGQTDPDIITVPAGGTVYTSVFPTTRFPNPVAIAYSAVTSLTVAVVS